jgi:hypothetical protein
MLMAGSAHAVGVDGRPCGEIAAEEIRKAEQFCLLGVSSAALGGLASRL